MIGLALIALMQATPQAEAHAIQFHYDELSRFERTLEAVEAGAEPEQAFSEYISSASPGFVGWMERYTVTPTRFVENISNFGEVYSELPALEPGLRDREVDIKNHLMRLQEIADNTLPVDVYYFVSSQHLMAGTPVQVNDSRFGVGIAVGAERRSNAGPAGAPLEDERTIDLMAFMVVHEASHILQIAAQGIENYRSIYNSDEGSMLAVAVREGCAEYLSFLVTGRRFSDRHLYVENHERALWEEFSQIAHEPPFSVPGWFSGVSESNPTRPFQIGYALGEAMCEAYHQELQDLGRAESELFAIYNANDIERVADAYDRHLRSAP